LGCSAPRTPPESGGRAPGLRAADSPRRCSRKLTSLSAKLTSSRPSSLRGLTIQSSIGSSSTPPTPPPPAGAEAGAFGRGGGCRNDLRAPPPRQRRPRNGAHSRTRPAARARSCTPTPQLPPGPRGGGGSRPCAEALAWRGGEGQTGQTGAGGAARAGAADLALEHRAPRDEVKQLGLGAGSSIGAIGGRALRRTPEHGLVRPAPPMPVLGPLVVRGALFFVRALAAKLTSSLQEGRLLENPVVLSLRTND